MDDTVTTLLRRTFDSIVAELDDDSLAGHDSPDPRPRRRWQLLVVAACLVLVVVSAFFIVSRAGDVERTTSGTDVVVGSTAVPGWYLPTYLPEGYELTGIAERTETLEDAMSYEIWVRKDDGVTTGYVRALVNEPIPSVVEAQSGRVVSIHGADAEISENPAETGSWRVAWTEGETRLAIETIGLDEDSTLAIAEASTVAGGDLSLDATSMPAEFTSAGSGMYDAGTEFGSVVLAAAPTGPTETTPIFMQIVGAATSLDESVRSETERRVVNGVEYSVRIDTQGTYSGNREHTTITWAQDGRRFLVLGELAADTLLDVAQGLRPATATEAAVAASETTDRALALPEHGRAELSDGRLLTVHASAESDAVDALCVADAEPRCFRIYLASASSGPPSGFYRVFDTGRDRLIVGWHATDPGGVATASDGSSVDIIEGTEGWFVTLTVATGEALPTIEFEHGSQHPSENHWP